MTLLSAGALLFDDAGHFLIVDPTYKAGWEIPGGIGERSIALDPTELSEHRFITARAIDDHLVPALGNRVRHALSVRGGGADVYADIDTISRYRST